MVSSISSLRMHKACSRENQQSSGGHAEGTGERRWYRLIHAQRSGTAAHPWTNHILQKQNFIHNIFCACCTSTDAPVNTRSKRERAKAFCDCMRNSPFAVRVVFSRYTPHKWVSMTLTHIDTSNTRQIPISVCLNIYIRNHKHFSTSIWLWIPKNKYLIIALARKWK